MAKVFLLTSGDGSDDEWMIISIHSTRELAEKAQAKYSEPQKGAHGTKYVRSSQIEEWEIDPEMEQ